jgi:hypothetical protein
MRRARYDLWLAIDWRMLGLVWLLTLGSTTILVLTHAPTAVLALV